MSKRRLNFWFLLLWSFNGVMADDKDNILDDLITKSKPIVALLFNKDAGSLSEATEDLTPQIQPLQPPHDRKAYLLYHILRTTQESERLDPEAGKKLEETESILRETLRMRCNYLDVCIRQCPPKKRYTCTLSCQEEYDDYDVCNRPKKFCFTATCGVTKPPYWKMLRKRI